MLPNAAEVTPPPVAMSSQTPPQQPQPLFRVPLAPPSRVESRLVGQTILERAAKSTRRLLVSPLIRRLPSSSYLTVCTSFLAPRDASVASTGKKRRSTTTLASSCACECAGVVQGCSLGGLVNYLRLEKVTSSFLVRQIQAVLVPVASAALKTRGVDAQVLCAGIASARTLRAQVAMLPAELTPPSMHSRCGNPTTVISTTASIFVVFTILSSDLCGSVPGAQLHEDVSWMIDNDSIEQVLGSAERLCDACVPLDGLLKAPYFEVAAVDAELRAIQRARAGVAAARRFATQHNLAPAATFRTMLNFYARAAWPIGELVNERTHNDLLTRLQSTEFYMTQPTWTADDTGERALVPLAALSGLVERRARGDAFSDASSSAASSVASSVASVASVESVGSVGSATSVGSVGSVEGALELFTVVSEPIDPRSCTLQDGRHEFRLADPPDGGSLDPTQKDRRSR